MQLLLVDDHPLFVDGLQDLLTRRGLTVLGVAYDGLDALHQARALRPEVILMDIHMPHCDGLTATRLIKAELPAIQIVMLTMSENDEHLLEAIKSGASGYLLKTLDTAEFMRLIEGLTEGDSPMSPGLAHNLLQELAHQPDHPANLTPRHQQVLSLMAQGLTYKEIGAILGLTERTIKYHVGEMVQRLHLENRAQVLAYAKRWLEQSG